MLGLQKYPLQIVSLVQGKAATADMSPIALCANLRAFTEQNQFNRRRKGRFTNDSVRVFSETQRMRQNSQENSQCKRTMRSTLVQSKDDCWERVTHGGIRILQASVCGAGRVGRQWSDSSVIIWYLITLLLQVYEKNFVSKLYTRTALICTVASGQKPNHMRLPDRHW